MPRSGAGQYDIYLLDDPWVPQFGAADVLEDLGAGGHRRHRRRLDRVADRHGLTGRRAQGRASRASKTRRPKLISVALRRRPADADLPQRRLHGRRTRDLGRPHRQGQGRCRRRHDQVSGRVPRRQRQSDRHQLVSRSSCPSAASSSTTNGTSPSTRRPGKAAADFFVGDDEAECTSRRRRVRLRPGRRRDSRRRGRRHHPILRQCAEGRRSRRRSKVAGKLDFGVVPKQEKAIAQIGIFIAGVPKSAPNKANAIEFLKWYTSAGDPGQARRGGLDPGARAAASPVNDPGNRLIPVALKQLDAGACRGRARRTGRRSRNSSASSSTRRCRPAPAAAMPSMRRRSR